MVDQTIHLPISGLGILLASPAFTEAIPEDSDFFTEHYSDEAKVQEYIQAGTIVGFGTGSPGDFILKFQAGYPSEERLRSAEFKYRLGLRCQGGTVCVRDLFDLMAWEQDCPEEQCLNLDDGIYHVTLCSDTPASGIIGDDQVIDVYLRELDTFPPLATEGIPSLC